jgi:hypothetical protein
MAKKMVRFELSLLRLLSIHEISIKQCLTSTFESLKVLETMLILVYRCNCLINACINPDKRHQLLIVAIGTVSSRKNVDDRAWLGYYGR